MLSCTHPNSYLEKIAKSSKLLATEMKIVTTRTIVLKKHQLYKAKMKWQYFGERTYLINIALMGVTRYLLHNPTFRQLVRGAKWGLSSGNNRHFVLNWAFSSASFSIWQQASDSQYIYRFSQVDSFQYILFEAMYNLTLEFFRQL